MREVDINCDMGETSVGHYRAIVKHVTSGNVACGFHAGSPEIMRDTVALCKRSGVGVGAHPSFQDSAGFGRKAVELPEYVLESQLLYQIGALERIAAAQSVNVVHVKAHGALYNMAVSRIDYAKAVAAAAKATGKVLIAPENSAMHRAAEKIGVKVVFEGFADRGYTSDGALAERGTPGALVTEPREAAERALKMVEGEPLRTVDGSTVVVNAKTICVHGDTPGAYSIAKAVRVGLEKAGVKVIPIGSLV